VLVDFKIQVFIYLLALLLVLSCVWLILLHRFFLYIRIHNQEVYKSLGSPDFKKLRSGKDIKIIKYIFYRNEGSGSDQENRKKKILRNYFLFYMFYSSLTSFYVIYSTFFKLF